MFKDDRGIKRPGQVEVEAAQRPGWYYVRDLHSGALHLVQWVDMEKVDQLYVMKPANV